MYARSLLVLVLSLEVLLGISPKADRFTWMMENAPVWLGLGILACAHRRLPLSRLCLTLLAMHALILMVGGHYTYAQVPLGEWVKNAFGLARNHYDRLGHFAQGFVPAILVREILLRGARLPRSGWIGFLCVCVCLAFSAFYELIEWWTALATGEAATDFLGTQGDAWDTQWDMLLALLGSLVALLSLARRHDQSMARLTAVSAETD